MKLNTFIAILLAIFLASTAFGQEATLKGKVLNATTKIPLANANVQVVGGPLTVTDKTGQFEITCTENMVIKVSYVGFQTIRQTVASCDTPLEIALQPQNSNLSQVEILGTSYTNPSQLYHPASITKIDATELKRNDGLFLDDAINTNVPGVYMQRRAVSSGQQFNIRGYGNGVGFRGASNNFDGQGVKVYLNNIPITDAEGITVLDDIDFSSLGNVEVTRGPAGSLYGFAIAGAVNLTTMKPKPGEVSIAQSALFGNYGLQRYTTSLMLGGEGSSLMVNYGHQESDGFMAHTASHKDFVNLAGEFKPNQKQTITTYFGYSNSYDARGGELTIAEYEAQDYSGNARYIKNNAHSEVISFRGGLGHQYQFGRHFSNHTTVFMSGIESNSSSAGGWTDKYPLNVGFRSTLDYDHTWKNNISLKGVAGAEVQNQYAQLTGYRMVADSSNLDGYNIIGDLRSNQVATEKTYSLFTEWTLSLPANFAITAGVGNSSLTIDLENRMYDPQSTMPRRVNAEYKNLVSPHLAINKVFNDAISVYASYSKGYKPPVSGNIVISTTGELNTGLVSEVGEQYEIGTKGSLLSGKLSYQAALFNTVFSNKMTAVAVPLDSVTTGYTFIANGGGQNNTGLELALNYQFYQSKEGFVSSISAFGNLTYSHFEYDNFQYQSINSDQSIATSTYSNNAVAGVSPFVGNLGIDFSSNTGLYANATYNYRDGFSITSDGLNTAHSYMLLNGKIGYRKTFAKHYAIDASFGANNITGVQYYYMVFVNQLADAYLPAPLKANYYGSLKLMYIF